MLSEELKSLYWHHIATRENISKRREYSLETVFYHYTDVNGLIGILENGKIWATNINYLNDQSEITYCKDLILSISKKLERKCIGASKKLILEVRDYFENYSGDSDAYVACFCEVNDLLSQWRGYASNSGGYAIGIAPSRHICINWDEDKTNDVKLRMYPVIYDPKTQKGKITRAINRTCKYLNDQKVEKKADYTSAKNLLFETLFIFLHTFKNPVFSEERERRVIIFSPDESLIKVRKGAYGLLPYIEIPIRFDEYQLIDSITLGPGSHKTLVSRSVKHLLKQNGYEGVDIKESCIPLVY